MTKKDAYIKALPLTFGHSTPDSMANCNCCPAASQVDVTKKDAYIKALQHQKAEVERRFGVPISERQAGESIEAGEVGGRWVSGKEEGWKRWSGASACPSLSDRLVGADRGGKGVGREGGRKGVG